jgi:hypothetical protein
MFASNFAITYDAVYFQKAFLWLPQLQQHACHLLCEWCELRSHTFGVFEVTILNKSSPHARHEGIQQKERYGSTHS